MCSMIFPILSRVVRWSADRYGIGKREPWTRYADQGYA